MSWFCEAALALGLLGNFCADGAEEVNPVVVLPADDENAWAYQPPASIPPPEPAPVEEPVPESPPFPPIVIVQPAPEVIVEPSSPPPQVLVEPPKPDPYEVALRQALAVQPQHGLVKIAGVAVDEEPGAPAGFNVAPAVPSAGATPGEEGIRLRYQAEGRDGGKPIDNTRILTADRYISGVVESGINSQLSDGQSGGIVIQTSRDVYGYHGRSVLVPKGSRLICDYESPNGPGKTRLALICKRILMAGHRIEIFQTGAIGGDVQGRAGITGEVDNRFWEKYGSAFIISGISSSVRLASAIAESETPEGSTLGATASSGAQELSEKFGEISASILEESVNLDPIITIPQGTRIQIRPQFDWYFREADKS